MHCYRDFAGAVKRVDGLTGEWEVEIGRSVYSPGNRGFSAQSVAMKTAKQTGAAPLAPHGIYRWAIGARFMDCVKATNSLEDLELIGQRTGHHGNDGPACSTHAFVPIR